MGESRGPGELLPLPPAKPSAWWASPVVAKTTRWPEYFKADRAHGRPGLFRDTEITALTGKKMRLFRPKMQIVFQDPYSSLNPRMVVLDLVGEGLQGVSPQKKKDLVVEVLERVGLSPEILYHYPTNSPGGNGRGSLLPGRLSSSRNCSSVMKPSPPLTSPSRPRSSTSWLNYARK